MPLESGMCKVLVSNFVGNGALAVPFCGIFVILWDAEGGVPYILKLISTASQ